MSFDKAKIMRAAEKNLAQGKIQAAIGDYCIIAENDTKDFNAMNLLGDLYTRVGAEAEAIKWFTHIAEQYSSQGFAHKAIAMFKKIARLKPNSVEISAKLAPLYQQQGLMAEARSHYLTVADAYKANGLQLESLEILGKIADLDPNNTEVRLKLAEGYLKENEPEKACEAFLEAASRMQNKGLQEDALGVFLKVLELRPVDVVSLKGATSAYLALGLPDEAVTILERALEVDNENVEIMSVIIQAYLEVENPAAAEEVARHLVVRDPGGHKKFLEIAQSFLKIADTKGATRAVAACSEQLLGRGQDKDLDHWVNEILKHNPENIAALKLLVRLHSWQRDEINLQSALERLVEAAQIGGEKLDEHTALAQLALIKTDDSTITDRLQELAQELGLKEETSSVWAESGVPSFDTYNQMANDESPVSFAPDAVENFHESALNFGSSDSGALSWNNETGNSFDYVAPAEEANSALTENSFSESKNNNPANENPAQNLNHTLHLKQELESVDFYILQGYKDLAAESLVMLEKQFGNRPEIEARKRNLEAGNNSFAVVQETTFEVAPNSNGNGTKISATDFDFEIVSASNGNGHHHHFTENKPREQFATSNGIDAGLAELFDEYRDSVQAEDHESSQGSDYETHYTLGLAYKEMGLLMEAVEEFQKAVKQIKPTDNKGNYLQCCNLMGHCFMEQNLPKPAATWFKKGLETPGQGEDEYQALRYELAIAYEASGDKHKAAELFSDIYAVDVSYRNVSEKIRQLQTL